METSFSFLEASVGSVWLAGIGLMAVRKVKRNRNHQTVNQLVMTGQLHGHLLSWVLRTVTASLNRRRSLCPLPLIFPMHQPSLPFGSSPPGKRYRRWTLWTTCSTPHRSPFSLSYSWICVAHTCDSSSMYSWNRHKKEDVNYERFQEESNLTSSWNESWTTSCR